MRQVVGADVDRALRADECEGKIGLLQPGLADTRKETDRPVSQSVHRLHRIAGDQPDALRGFLGVRLRDRPAVPGDRGLAPAGCAAKVGHHVEDMAAEDPQILRATAGVFLSAAPQFQEPADAAVLDEIADDSIRGAVTIDHRQREFRAGRAARGDHRIRLGRRADKGLLHEDPLHTRLRRRDRHLRMAVDVPHAERDDVRLYLREHGTPIAERRPGRTAIETEPLDGLRQPLGRLVGHGDEGRPVDRSPQLVDRMPPVAPARPADHRDAHRFHRCPFRCLALSQQPACCRPQPKLQKRMILPARRQL